MEVFDILPLNLYQGFVSRLSLAEIGRRFTSTRPEGYVLGTHRRSNI